MNTKVKKSHFAKSLKNSAGMTLMEILIVLAILGSLIAILLPQVTERLNKSKVGETKIIIGQAINALNMYFTDCGRFPESIEGLITADASCTNWGPEAYIKKPPKDAWQHPLVYSVEGSSFILKSLGADGREGGDGNNKDISSEELQ